MNALLDTNILLRMAQPGHVHHQLALDAADALRRRGDSLFLVAQNLYEYWVVATRPAAANGLGLSVAQTAAELAQLKTLFTLLPDTPTLFSEWEKLVTTYQVEGKNAHDARLVAAMVVHGLTHLLTFNGADFSRFTNIVTLDPASVVPPASTGS
jgi:predicted nucleic acid-binding protein